MHIYSICMYIYIYIYTYIPALLPDDLRHAAPRRAALRHRRQHLLGRCIYNSIIQNNVIYTYIYIYIYM